MRKSLLAAALFAASLAAQMNPVEAIIVAARAGSPELKEMIAKNGGNIRAQGAVFVWGQDYVFAAQADREAAVAIDGAAPVAMIHIADSNLWYYVVKMRTGVTHAYEFHTDGRAIAKRDVAGYNPDSYPKAGVPQGKVSEMKTIQSKLYPGSSSNYWVYASPGVDPNVPAPVMVWQDGQNLTNRDFSGMRLFTVTENLVAQKLIPPMIHIMVQPGSGQNMRSIQYDTMTDKFGHYLIDEILPEVEKTYKLRQDGYSRAIAGESSGAICAWTVAWFFPDKFSRVQSTIGSYTSIQWHPETNLDGGNVWPFKIRKEPKKNIRIWQSDGSDDLENQFGSWPSQAVNFANSLKLKEYDFHFRFGEAAHNSSQAALDLPESLVWLWRGYDPSKTTDTYQMDPSEKSKPPFRFKIVNRDAW